MISYKKGMQAPIGAFLSSALAVTFLLPFASCQTMAPPEMRDTCTLDITITSDPPGAQIFTLPSASQYSDRSSTKNFAHDLLGPQRQFVGTTPYRGQIHAKRAVPPEEGVQYSSTDGTLALLEDCTQRRDDLFLISYFCTQKINYLLSKPGYQPEPISHITAQGKMNLYQILGASSARPIQIFTKLLPAASGGSTGAATLTNECAPYSFPTETLGKEDLYKRALRVSIATDPKKHVELLTRAAESGHVVAQLELGGLYQAGKYVSKDNHIAIGWFRKAAAAGSPQAYTELSCLYRAGEGVQRDAVEADRLLKKAAELGDANAMRSLALASSFARDDLSALSWYTRAAEAGDASCWSGLGDIYLRGRGVTQDVAKAIALYKKAADAGYPWVYVQLGDFFLEPHQNSHDELQAIRFYRAAADAGVPAGSRKLGDLYLHGKGVFCDQQEAMRWYRKAAEANDTETFLKLGALYFNGEGVEKNQAQSIMWFERAAQSQYPGGPSAYTALAKLFERQPDGAAKAIDYYTKAASLNDDEACLVLGDLYSGIAPGSQIKIQPDAEVAIRWYRKAADKGSYEACIALGRVYFAAGNPLRNEEEAERWFLRAAESEAGRRGLDTYKIIVGFYLAQGKLEEAVRYSEAGAANGDKDVYMQLSFYYREKRQGVPAAKWARKSAELGSGYALSMLAAYYETGFPDLPIDLAEALKWYRKGGIEITEDALRARAKKVDVPAR